MRLLHEAGRPDDALALLDERSAEFIEEHPSWFSSNRIWLLGEAGRHEEALAYAQTLQPDTYGLRTGQAWILEEMGRIEEALTLLRADTELRSSRVAELVIRQGRAAEAVAGMPSLPDRGRNSFPSEGAPRSLTPTSWTATGRGSERPRRHVLQRTAAPSAASPPV
ncbi:hypothetical protein ABT246_40310 [Streptomyces sp. NPDC001553]|uniref:hypothetical protein n=1 Tax=Streptomyces sp. NPDC001553 TaxID=3154385 RepID=UPI00332EBA20